MRMERSNSLPLPRSTSMLNGVPTHRFIDDTTIQILIDRPEPGKLDRPEPDEQVLYHYADTLGKWQPARSIYVDYPNLLRIPLTASGDTALHVAVSANNSDFVRGLVSLDSMTPEVLEIANVDGNTAFCIAVIIGNSDFLKTMMTKNQNLPIIRGYDGMLPVHLAALSGYHKIVQYLSSDNLLQMMEFKDVEKLFFMTINSNMYDVANILVEKYPKELVVARYDKKLTALHMLAQKSPEEEYDMREMNKETASSSVGVLQMVLLETLWSNVRKLESNVMSNLITHPSVVLFDAVKSGNDEVVIWLLFKSRELLTIKDRENGQSLLHYAVLYRRYSLIKFILQRSTAKLIIRSVDNDRNNFLHYAARLPEGEEETSLRPNSRMQRELVWFQEVEKISPPGLRAMRNKDGKTPRGTFYATHMKLSNEVKEEAKGVAGTALVVATLIASVAFAAARTVPGDKSSAAAIVFILTNAIALFTSSASIVSFLSIFASSGITKRGYVISLHSILILNLGLSCLFISIASMLIAFAASSFLIFDDKKYKWVAYVAASFGFLPIVMFPICFNSDFWMVYFNKSFGMKTYLFAN